MGTTDTRQISTQLKKQKSSSVTCLGTESSRNTKHYYSDSDDCTYSYEVQMAFKSKDDNIINLFSNHLKRTLQQMWLSSEQSRAKTNEKNLPKSQLAIKVSWLPSVKF